MILKHFSQFLRVQKVDKEKGIAMTELAAVLPFLLLMVTGVVETGMMLDSYLRLTRAVYEGVRYGATVPGLTTGTYDPNTMQSSFSSTHKELQDRVKLILADYNIDSNSATLTTSRGSVSGVNDVVNIQVSIPYNSIFTNAFAKNMNLTISANGPYLQSN